MSFSEIFPMNDNSVEIGEKVKTTLRTATGSQQVIGTLIGKSGMDLTPVDLFNDILLSEKDIVNFIKQTGADPYSQELPGLIIQVIFVDFSIWKQGILNFEIYPQKQISYIFFLIFQLSGIYFILRADRYKRQKTFSDEKSRRKRYRFRDWNRCLWKYRRKVFKKIIFSKYKVHEMSLVL